MNDLMQQGDCQERVEFQIAKGKVYFLMAIAMAVLIALGAAWLYGENRFLASVGIAFIAFVSAFGIAKIINTQPALVLDLNGILISRSVGPAGLVKWQDILALKLERYGSDQLLVVEVSNPDEYKCRGSVSYRFLQKIGAEIFGSPICISTKFIADSPAHIINAMQSQRIKYLAHQHLKPSDPGKPL